MITELNHVAIYVADLERSIRFYSEIIGLKTIPRPAFDFPGEWFQIGETQQLHLIGGKDTDEQNPQSRYNHFALRINSYVEMEELLKSKGAEFIAPRKRPDGAMQIFIQDPDGYYIELVEINDAD
jgi:catechol 2,3-dioxygenase-like lactoylglutathione lyase family enzyme